MAKVYNDNVFRVCTHDGEFHADEVFAVAVYQMLAQLRFASGQIDGPPEGAFQLRRSRLDKDFDWANTVVDVGGKYEVDRDGRSWLDHHQPGGAGARPDVEGRKGIPYAAFGLVWRHMGETVVEAAMRPFWKDMLPTTVVRIVQMVDAQLVAAIDAADNGVRSSAEIQEYGFVPSFPIGKIISNMNPVWSAELPGKPKMVGMTTFSAALHLAGEILFRNILSCLAEIEAESTVVAAYTTRDNPRILMLPHNLPWRRVLLKELEDNEVMYVVHPGDASTPWMVTAVPEKTGSPKLRKPFPESWGGLRDAKLTAVSGASYAVFCHKNLFIAGSKSMAGARLLAELSIKWS